MNILKQIQLLFFVMMQSCLVVAMDLTRIDDPDTDYSKQHELEQKTEAKDARWIPEALSKQQYGSWVAQDSNNQNVIVEGEMISGKGQLPQNGMKAKKLRFIHTESDLENLASLYANVMMDFEMELIKAYPAIQILNKIETIYHWEKNYKDVIRNSYIEEITKILLQPNNDPIYLFTIRKPMFGIDGKKQFLGTAMFEIRKDYAYGTIKMSHFAVKLEAQQQGLERILASSIFKLLPQTERIFTETNYKNEKSMKTYEELGFFKCAEYCFSALYEYREKEFFEKLSSLKKLANETLKEIIS